MLQMSKFIWIHSYNFVILFGYTRIKMNINTINSLRRYLIKTPVSISEISKSSKVSRTSIHRFINGDTLKENTANKIIKAIQHVYNEHIVIHDDLNQTKEIDVDASYIIELQKDKIQALKTKIDTLQDALESKQAESTHWNNLNFDYTATVQLTIENFKLSRKITKIDNLDIQSKYLGYSEEKLLELWQVNKIVLQKDWLINQIIDKSSVDEMNKKIKTLPQVFDIVKNMVGNHYIPHPIIYIHKDGHRVPAISYNKIVWRDMVVYSKVEFLGVN